MTMDKDKSRQKRPIQIHIRPAVTNQPWLELWRWLLAPVDEHSHQDSVSEESVKTVRTRPADPPPDTPSDSPLKDFKCRFQEMDIHNIPS